MRRDNAERVEGDGGDCRCPCGRLLARRREDEGVSVRCRRCKRTRLVAGAAEAECRCDCGRLIARLGPSDAELRCPRCKRFVVVALGQA